MMEFYNMFRDNYMTSDKMLHFTVSLLVTVMIFLLTSHLCLSVLITLLIGVLKELIWDGLMKKGTTDSRDMLANIVGIVVGVAFIYGFQL